MKITKEYLGVNSKTKMCCIIKTDGIICNFDATNWNGHDKIERTLKLRKYKVISKEKYQGIYRGTDYDCGHEYPFNFRFDEIWEVVKTT